jgi:serine/threonine protein kinase
LNLSGDLKPQNIIINEQDHLVLIDLGLSKKLNQVEVDEKGIVKAFSKNWSAPEQIAGQRCETTSDVYSLGYSVLFFIE